MPSENTDLLNLVGNVTDPTQVSMPDGSSPPVAAGRQAESLVGDLHGKYFTGAFRSKLFLATAVAVTVPVIANNLVSVFTLVNPQGSGILMEMVEVNIVQALAATVVDQFGWYYSTPPATIAGTFTTPGTTVQGARIGYPSGRGLFYSAYTHSGTPVLTDVIGSFGGVTNLQTGMVNKVYDGRLILPPGIAMSIAGATTISTASGLNIQASWTEWPL